MALGLGSIIPGVGRRFKLRSGEIDSAQILKTHLAGGFLKMLPVAGQDETSDTTIPVTGLAVGDELVSVMVFDPGDGMGADILFAARALADFTITDGILNVADNAANNAGHFYLVTFLDLT